MSITLFRPRAYALPVMLLPFCAFAQNLDVKEKLTNSSTLSTVVVTASGAEVDIQDAPASISVITREEIERSPVYDLATLLRRIPGVSGGLSPMGEQSKIKLRGLPDKYTLILVDGKRQGSSADAHYRANLGRQDLNWISPEMIERIEIVRGPMSSLYGSEAMGGVINIITRKIGAQWGGSASLNYTHQEDSDRGDAQQTSFSLSGPLTPQVGLRLTGSATRQDADETVGDVRGDSAGGVRDRNVNALLNWQLTPQQLLSLEASNGVQKALESKARNAAGTNPLVDSWGARELVQTGLSLGHEGAWGVNKSKVRLYSNHYDHKSAPGTAKSSNVILDASLDTPITWGLPHLLTTGLQWQREEVENSSTIGAVPIDPNGKPISPGGLSGNSSAIFAEDQILLHEKLTLTLGGRLDRHAKFGTNFSPRVYVVYHPAPDWTLRSGLSRGFRAPSLKENTSGAATRSGGGGCASLRPLGYVSGGCYMAGNSNLEPETSQNAELGVAYNRNGWDAGLTYFHTNFKNKIDYAPLGFFHGFWWTQMQNIQKARTRGLEGVLNVPITHTLELRNSLTYMLESKNLTTNAPLIASPKLSLASSLNWNVNTQWITGIALQHTGKQSTTGGSNPFATTDFVRSFTTYDAFANYHVTQKIRLRAGLENLSNARPSSDGSTRFYVPGRRVFMGITARL